MFIVYVLLLVSLAIVNGQDQFEIIHQWRTINFTWPSEDAYNGALQSGRYIPENVLIDGIKIWGDRIFMNIPQMTAGVPVALGYIRLDDQFDDPLITPFPSWEFNIQEDCNTLQSIQSFEIDPQGVMWILDGIRFNNFTSCPPKLVLIDIESEEVVHVVEFPSNITLHQGGFLNDIVIDESDGVYAYIADASTIDPGLIVYSRETDRLWKYRDASMFSEPDAPPIVVNGSRPRYTPTPIDGIALSQRSADERFVYYCPLQALQFYSINTNLLKDEASYESGEWRWEINHLGTRTTPTDGMTIDENGNLYITLLNEYGIGIWDTNTPFNISVFFQDEETVLWPDSFAFDNQGSLYFLSDNIQAFVDSSRENDERTLSDVPLFRIFRRFINARSYMY